MPAARSIHACDWQIARTTGASTGHAAAIDFKAGLYDDSTSKRLMITSNSASRAGCVPERCGTRASTASSTLRTNAASTSPLLSNSLRTSTRLTPAVSAIFGQRHLAPGVFGGELHGGSDEAPADGQLIQHGRLPCCDV